MLSTRGLGLVGRWSAGVYLMAGVCGLGVTGCQNGVNSANLAAAGEGEQSEAGGAAPAAAGTGQQATTAGQAQLGSAGGGGRPGVVSGSHTGGQLGGENDPATGGGTNASGGSIAVEPKRYPGQGFIVHEWGTDTIVVGSDGSLQRGLQHEEEDLPSFVYDRIKAGTLIGSSPSPSVTIKMETPVTYFYSATPVLVNARVDFPKGVLTQWYPGVTGFLPPLAAPDSVSYPGVPAALADPALDPSFPFVGETCRLKFASASGGRLDWGNFTVQARGMKPEKPLPSAPLEHFGWSYARDVDANLLEMPSGESERFLFYRGLGEFDLPVKVEAAEGAKIKLTNYSEAVGSVFLLNVSHERGAFTEHSEGIAKGASLEDTVPSLQRAPSVDEYAAQLSDAVIRALDATGLYHDEVLAMVNTWRRQWFRTPGVRALYLLPQSWTDQSIPLTIGPKPDATVRVMLIRAELITKEQESADVSAVSAFETDTLGGAAYFTALGRFAEPRLRRALQLSPSVAGEQYLAQIAHAKSSMVSGE